MNKHVLLVLWLAIHFTTQAQFSPYSKEVLRKIKQVEQHLASDFLVPNDKDWTIQQRMKQHHVHGLSIAVVHNYQIEWAKAYGWADSAHHRRVTTETRFQAGSISKSLNGVGVLTLVQEGKIDLYTDINQYLIRWKFAYDSAAKGKRISTANLLSHTAGLSMHGFPGYAAGEVIPDLNQVLDGRKPANTEAVRSLFEPGLKFQYSGGGTTISQRLLVDQTHQPYDQYMAKRVLEPMGMANSSFTQPPAKNGLLATGYNGEGQPVAGRYRIYPEQAAAGLWTTPIDLCRYIIETQLAYQGKSSKVLNQQTTRLRLTPYIDGSAALGVFINKKGADTYFLHNGSNEGFLGMYYGSLTHGNGVVVMVNSANGPILDEIINSVARVYDWKDFYKPITRRNIHVPATILDTYVGEYEFVPGYTLTVTREHDQLRAKMTSQSKVSLLAENQTRFYLEATDVHIDFLKADSSQVTQLLMFRGSRKYEAKRIK